MLVLPLQRDLHNQWAKHRTRRFPLLILFSVCVMNKRVEYWWKFTDMEKPTRFEKTGHSKILNYKKITNWLSFEIGAPQ
jgi:hypothetical protein